MPVTTITAYPSGYINTKSASISNVTNGYTGSDSNTYSQINLTTGSGAITEFYYTFDLSIIPDNTIIQSVECTVAAKISSTSTSFINTSSMRLYSGSTAKGSEDTTIGRTGSVVSLNTNDTWTREELNDCRIRLYAKRGTSNTSTIRYIRFYGATLTVTYSESTIVPIVGNVTIDGVAKEFVKGYINIDGVQKQLVKSYANVDGVWCPTWGEKRFYGDLSVGETINLNVDGSSYEWIVVQQGNPSSSVYDSSCNGTWLLMKDLYTNMIFDTTDGTYYSNSDVHTYLNNTFLGLIDSDIQSIIKEVIIPVTTSGNSGTLTTKVFLLSITEVGLADSSGAILINEKGTVLSYFNGADDVQRIAYYNEQADDWWTRTCGEYFAGMSYWCVRDTGKHILYSSTTSSVYVRPAIIMPSDAECDIVIGGINRSTST